MDSRRLLTADELLLQRETRNLKYTILGRLIFGLGMIIGEVFAAQNRAEQVLAIPLMAAVIFSSIIFFVNLSTKRSVKAVGMIGLCIDCLLIIFLPYLWFLSVEGLPYRHIYVSKTIMTIMAMSMIAYNSLAMRPLYPAVMSAVSFAVHLLLTLEILRLESGLLTPDGYKFRMSAHFSPFIFASEIAFMMGTGILLSYLASTARRTILNSVQLERTNSFLNRFFSPSVANQIQNSDESFFRPGGSLHQISVMFCDIQGFTSICERMSPDEVMTWLSHFHETMVSAIFDHNGTLDKFIGDGIMATFGTPSPNEESALDAVTAAMKMQENLVSLNDWNRTAGLPEIYQRIGIHFGDAIIGNVGTENRLEYTAIGDIVNIASRIESACKEIGTPILFSAEVNDRVADKICTRFVRSVSLRGREKPIDLYTVV